MALAVGRTSATENDEPGRLLQCLVDHANEAHELYLPKRVPIIKHSISPLEFYREYVSMNRPCVFSKTALTDVAEWKAHSKWTVDHLETVMGDKQISIEVTPNGRGDAIHNGYFIMPQTTKMTIKQFFQKQQTSTDDKVESAPPCNIDSPGSLRGKLVRIHGLASRPELNGSTGVATTYNTDRDRYGVEFGSQEKILSIAAACLSSVRVQCESDGPVYYLSHQCSNLSEEFQSLFSDVAAPALATEAFGCEPDASNIWIGPDKAITSTHKDHYENFYTVVAGTKVFVLYPPSDSPFLHQASFRSAIYEVQEDGQFDIVPLDTSEIGGTRTWVPIDPDSPDSEKHHLYKYATPIKIEVHAGETLYLPSLWFHRVSQQGDACFADCTVAVNFWYDMSFGPNYVHFRTIESLASDLSFKSPC